MPSEKRKCPFRIAIFLTNTHTYHVWDDLCFMHMITVPPPWKTFFEAGPRGVLARNVPPERDLFQDIIRASVWGQTKHEKHEKSSKPGGTAQQWGNVIQQRRHLTFSLMVSDESPLATLLVRWWVLKEQSSQVGNSGWTWFSEEIKCFNQSTDWASVKSNLPASGFSRACFSSLLYVWVDLNLSKLNLE